MEAFLPMAAPCSPFCPGSAQIHEGFLASSSGLLLPCTEGSVSQGRQPPKTVSIRLLCHMPMATCFKHFQVQRAVPSTVIELLAFLASLVTLCGHRVSHQRGRPPCLRQEHSWGEVGTVCLGDTAPYLDLAYGPRAGSTHQQPHVTLMSWSPPVWGLPRRQNTLSCHLMR